MVSSGPISRGSEGAEYLIPLIYCVVFVSFSLWSEFQKTQHM